MYKEISVAEVEVYFIIQQVLRKFNQLLVNIANARNMTWGEISSGQWQWGMEKFFIQFCEIYICNKVTKFLHVSFLNYDRIYWWLLILIDKAPSCIV